MKLIAPLPWVLKGLVDQAEVEKALQARHLVVVVPSRSAPLGAASSAKTQSKGKGKGGSFKSSVGSRPSFSQAVSSAEATQPYCPTIFSSLAEAGGRKRKKGIKGSKFTEVSVMLQLRLGRLRGWEVAWPASSSACKTVHKGLPWPWIWHPPLQLPPSHIRVTQAVAAHFQEMLPDRVVEWVSCWVFLSRMFTVSKNDSSETRLVVDLSHLNHFIATMRFRMLKVLHVRAALRRGSWITVVNFKSAY